MDKIKFNLLNFLNILLFFGILANAEESFKNIENLKTVNSTIKDNNFDEIIQNSFLGKKYDLFLPKYDFQRPYKFRKEQYSKIMKYASEFKRKTEVPSDVYIMGDDLIQEYEETFKKEILYRIINKEVNLEEVVYDDKYDVYAYPDISAYKEYKPKFLENEDFQMKNYDDLGNFLKFSQKKIEVADKPICIATMVILNILNTRNENIIIKSIRSDLFQAAIFIPKNKEMPHSYNQKNLYPRILSPDENFSLQVIILPDMVGKTVGNIYFELADNKVIVYPVEIKAVENIYKISPIYVHNWQGSKLFISHINLYNPHSKTLIIKEVINSFSSINLIWPNGQPVSSNHTSISSNMLEVPAKSTKNILQINFYKDVPGVEYGLLQLKTDRDTLIIPVVVGVEVQVIRFFPNFYNFGVIDVNRKIKRLIPISLSNLGLIPVQIKTIYSSFEENLVEFIPNLNNFFCNFDLILSGLSLSSFSMDSGVKSGISPQNPNSYSNNICIISRVDNMNNFGFLMIDPSNYRDDLNGKYLNKKTRGSIIIQTNYTDNPFIELTYEYYLDKNTISFEKEPELNYYNNRNIIDNENKNQEIYFDLKGVIKPPFYTTNKDIWKNSTNEINNTIANSNGNVYNNNNNNLIMSFERKDLANKGIDNLNDVQEIREINLNLKIKNVQSFQNKKNYFFPIKLNNNMITLFPVKLYDKSIELHYCDIIENYKDCLAENYSAYKSINFKSQTINIDFGLLSTSEAGKKYFNLINDNGENLKIIKVESTKPLISICIESIEDIQTNKKTTNIYNKKYEIGKNIPIFKKSSDNNNESDIQLVIPSECYLTLSVVVLSQNEQDLNGSIYFYFENNKILTVNVNSKFLKGNLNITPSIVRFEPAFPGLFQSKLVSSKSSYNIPINIHSIKSNDQRIIPVILTNSIISNNRTEILKIIFDPSKVEIEENFMKGDSFANSTSRHLTYKELYLWKEKQKLWEILGSQGRTEINTVVKIKTNIQTESVNVRGFLTKPSLVKKDEIEFGLVQVGEANTAHIEVFNPSDEPMSIQILLAPEEYADIHNNSMFFNNKQRLFPLNNITLLECNYFNISNFIDQTSQNFTQNFINNRSKKRSGKKKGDDIIDINGNSILLEEEISNIEINQRIISKQELLKKIFLYTNVNSKLNFLESERIICNTNFFKKNEIIFNNNKDLIEKLFSEEFMKEINIIKRMTDRTPPSINRAILRENNLNIFERIAQYLKIFFKTDVPQRKKKQDDYLLNSPNGYIKQEFFLPKSLSSQVFIIKPHQKTKIGPILYSPSNYSVNSTATLFIKNNLTVLYPIKLKGHGGSGVLNFFLLNSKLQSNKITKEQDNNEKIYEEEKIDKLIIDINSLDEIEENNGDIMKEIKIKNTGNLPVKVFNVTLKDSGCNGYGIKLSSCDGFLLQPGKHVNLTISLTPDFNFYYMEKEILFESTHQTISIKILISISNEILSQKNKLLNLNNIQNNGFFSLGGSLFIILIIILVIKKEQTALKNNESVDKSEKFINFVGAKEIIDKNGLLKFENLFIKAYRKNNRAFYEEFFSKHMEAPSKQEIENLISDKKKKNIFNNKISEYSKNQTDEPDYMLKASPDDTSSQNKNFDKRESKEINCHESEARETQISNNTSDLVSKSSAKERSEAYNKNQGKRSIPTVNTKNSTTPTTNANTKKAASKKPYGIALKGQESNNLNQSNINLNKKEDDKKTLHNILNNVNNPNFGNINSQSLLPGSIYNPGLKYDAQVSNTQNKLNLNQTGAGLTNNIPTGKDDISNLPSEFYANQINSSWGDPSFYQAAAMGFWPKNYAGTTNYQNYSANQANIKRFPTQQNFDANSSTNFANQGKNVFINTYNSFTGGIEEKRSNISLNPNNPSFISQQYTANHSDNTSNISTPLNPEAPTFIQSNVLTGNLANNANSEEVIKNTNNIGQTSGIYINDTKCDKKMYIETNENNIHSTTSNFANFKNIDFTIGDELQKSGGTQNIKEQFMSFVPGFLTQETYNNNNDNKNMNNIKNDFLNMNFITPDNDTSFQKSLNLQNENYNKNFADNDELDFSQINRMAQNNINPTENNGNNLNNSINNNLMGNFKMIDFTNYFNNPITENNNTSVNKNNTAANNFGFSEIETSNLNNENSDNEDNNFNSKHNFEDNESINENEYEFNKYKSEKEKLIEDSVNEDRDLDIKFNFNSIFGQNNMKLINPSYNDFTGENEEPKQNLDGNKPYFDKNLFFSFDSVFNTNNKTSSSFFNNGSTNLFSANTKTTNLLSELRDDDHEETNAGNKGNNWESKHNRLDDVVEIDDDEDDEEDPIWNNEEIDINKEGYFDATGNYKLKQMMDYNFRK